MKTPRRVLILHDYAGDRGGAELLAMDLRRGLRSRGIETRLLTSTADPWDEDQAPDSTCPGRTDRLRVISEMWNPSAAQAVADELRRFQPDVVQIIMFLSQLSPAILRVLDGVPTVYAANTYRICCPTGLRWRAGEKVCTAKVGFSCCRFGCISPLGLLPRMMQLFFVEKGRKRLSRIVAPSRAMARILEDNGWLVDDVVPYSVEDTPRTRPISAEPVIAFAGRLTEEKGVQVLVQAMARGGASLASARLLIVGDGPYRPALEKVVANSGLRERTDFAGHLERADSQRLLERAWVQVVPSLWPEPFGLVAAEAMMRGTALITSDSGALPEIAGRDGIVVPAGDVSALTAALVDVVADRERAEALGQKCLQVAVQRQLATSWIDRYVDIYRELLASRQAAS